MKILAIETSCDETAVAVVSDGRKVLANVIASQIDLHAKTGGVVPEIAAREHVLKMIPVLDEALEQAGIDWHDIEALAITKGPGLVSSLIVGTETANVISYVKQKPLIPIHHILGHIYSNWLDRKDEVKFPIIILTVSGGHNELILMHEHGKFEVLGETRDDAAGEAFDKVARILELGYPGGPAISKIALKGSSTAFKFPRAMLEKDSLDFSFSGLKTAVLEVVKRGQAGRNDLQFKADLAASFQEAVVEVLVEKLFRAYKKYPEVRELHLAGGVSANTRLREAINEKLPKDLVFKFPKSLSYCTDNAAMIAAAGYFMYSQNSKKFSPCSNIIPSTSFELA